MDDSSYYDTDNDLDSLNNYDWIYEDNEVQDIVDSNDDDYFDSYENGGGIEIGFMELLSACIIPTLSNISYTLFPIFGMCLLFHFIHHHFTNCKDYLKHALSALLGLTALFMHFHYLMIHPIALCIFSYAYICITPTSWRYKSFLLAIMSFLYLVCGEFYASKKSWQKIYNVQMIIVMKVVSLIIDSKDKKFPTFVEFCGYILCVGNCIFGPWVSYKNYLKMYNHKTMDMRYFLELGHSLIWTLVFFIMSVCYVEWFIPDTDYMSIKMYKKALEFRTSHYFIMFLSEAFAIGSGLGYECKTGHTNVISVSKPFPIELPRSLIEIVIYWNIPMHKWFRKYIFATAKQYGIFMGLFCTYLVSSLLHGLNYQLSACLLSLAFYTYIEHGIRLKLSNIFDACLLSRRCEVSCKIHKYQQRNFLVFMANIAFSILALYHLNYLGYLIDIQGHTFEFRKAFTRWQNVDFNSHIIAFFTYIVYKIL